MVFLFLFYKTLRKQKSIVLENLEFWTNKIDDKSLSLMNEIDSN